MVDHNLVWIVGWDDVCIGFTLRLIPAQLEYCTALESYLAKIAQEAPNRWAAGAKFSEWGQ